MAKKKWCIAKSHPVVVEMADKYNLTREQAKNILTEARKRNPSLNDDDLPLSFLEDTSEFKEELNSYIKKQASINDVFLKPAISTKEIQSRRTEIEEYLGKTVSPDQLEAIMANYNELVDYANTANTNKAAVIRVISAFKNPKRLTFIGHWITQRTTELMLNIQRDAALREREGIPYHNTRKEYYVSTEAQDYVKDTIYYELEDQARKLKANGGDKDLISELLAARTNLDTILYMYGTNMYRTEGVRITPEGLFVSTDSENEDLDRNEGDGENDENQEAGESPTNSFSVSDSNVSVSSKIVADIKTLLATFKDTDRKGNAKTDQFGYGLNTYISPNLAMNKILLMTQGCTTMEEMINVFQNNVSTTPWLQQLIDAVDTSTTVDSNGVETPLSRKEQLRTLAFKSFRKQWTRMRQQYTSYDRDGNPISVSRDANVNHYEDRIRNKLLSIFRTRSGAEIFKNGNIDLGFTKKHITPNKVNSEVQRIKGIMRDEASAYIDGRSDTVPTFDKTYKELSALEDEMLSLLRAYGVNVTKKTLDEALVNTLEEADKNPDVIKTSSGDIITGSIPIATMLRKVKILSNRINDLTKSYKSWLDWMDRQRKAGKTVVDKRSTNPLVRAKNNSDYPNIMDIRNNYEKIITFITRFSTDGIEPSAHAAGKEFYAINNPSSAQTIVEGLMSDTGKMREFIRQKYAKDTLWFLNDDSTADSPHFYSDWLEYIYYGSGNQLIEYSELPSVNGKKYEELSDREYALAIQQDYFNMTGMRAGAEKDGTVAWYRLHIASDKPRFSSIRFRKYNKYSSEAIKKGGYKNVIAEKALPFFSQELKRSASVLQYAVNGNGVKIKNYDPDSKDGRGEVYEKIRKGKRITTKDVVKNGRYIFRNTGVSFFQVPFIVDEIEQNTPLGQYVIDRVFNEHLYPQQRLAVDEQVIPVFTEAFHGYMSKTHDKYVQGLEKTGLYAEKSRPLIDKETGERVGNAFHMKYIQGMLRQWNPDSKDLEDDLRAYDDQASEFLFAEKGIEKKTEDGKRNPEYYKWIPYYRERCMYEDMLEEFVYNNWLAKVNMAQIFDVDLAFYGTTTNFQKRNAQIVSAGYAIDPTATLHGKRVSDGKFRSITIKTPKTTSDFIDNIRILLENRAKQITDPKVKAQFEAGIQDAINALTDFDPTDGQGLTSLSGLRKKMVGLGTWTRSDTSDMDDRDDVFTDEAVYRRIKKGTVRAEDYMHVFNQPTKPFVYAFTTLDRDGREMTVPVQHKNSEYALIFLSAFQEVDAPTSQVAAISRFMEETLELNPLTGVDTVNFDSVVKIGEGSNAIDITDLDGPQTLEALQNAVFEYQKDEKGNYVLDKNNKKIKIGYKKNIVTEYDEKEWKIQQEKGEHFKGNQQPTGSQLKILAINNIPDDMECTLPDGSKITGKELKKMYFDLLRQKMMKAETAAGKRFGLFMPKRSRLNKLSRVLRDMASSDSRFTSEEAQALSIVDRNGEPVFALPLDDMGHQAAIEAKVLSTIRKVYYREKSNGGIVVQATSWGEDNDLAIRFYSSAPEDQTKEENKGLISTYKEYAERHKELSGSQLKASYDAYREKYQGGYAYMECEVPMPDYVRDMLTKNGRIQKRFFNPDGTWNMKEIRKEVPDSVFDAICYRVPTEAKYSMMVCRVVRFCKENSGSIAKYPKELTVFTGSDFDIDTDTVELRPIPGSALEEIDNKIFDLQLAALRSQGAVQETFKPGDFSDLSDLSYRVTLLSAREPRYDDEGEPMYDKNGQLITRAKYGIDYVASLDTKKVKALCEDEEGMDIMSPLTDIVLRNQNADAGTMIGIAAVGVTSHAFISLYNDPMDKNNTTRIVIGDEDEFTIVSKDGTTKTFSGEIPLDMMYDMDGKLISTEISKYVGASADAAKDAALYRLNITQHTLPLLLTMHRLGISSDVARLFMAHPVMRRASEIWNDNQNMRATTVADMIIEEFGLSDEEYQEAVADASKNRVFKYDDLIDAITNPEKVNLENKMKVCTMLYTLASLSDSIRNLDSFSRYNSTNAMKGSSFLDRFAKRQQLERLQDNIDKENARILLPDNIAPAEGYPESNYGKLCAMFPYVAQAIFGEEELTEQLLLDNMPTYSAVFFDAAQTLGIESNPASLKRLYAGWKNYLLFVGPNRIADFRDEKTAKFYTREFANYYTFTLEALQNDPEVADVMSDNSFLDNIGNEHAKEGYGDFQVLTTNITNMSGQELEKFKQDWESLLIHPKTRKFAIDIAIHFLARSAAFSNNTPVHAIPFAVKQAIPNYFTAFDDANKFPMTSQEVYNFCVTVALNNTDDENIVPEFFTSDDSESIVLEGGKLRMRATKRIMENFIVKDENQIIFKVPVITVTNLTSNQSMCVRLNSNVAEVIEEAVTENGKVSTDTKLVFDAELVTPLGIPNQMAEYTRLSGTDSILLDDGQTPPSPEERKESPDAKQDYITPSVDMPFDISTRSLGARTGTYIESSPFSNFTMKNYSIGRVLSRDRRDLINNPFIESREHIGRVEKLAGILNLDMLGQQRVNTASGPAYSFNVSSSTIDSDQHTKAKELAALVGALGYETGTTTVKTYVEPGDNYNAVEFSIPVTTASKYREIIETVEDILGKDADISVNNERGELIISVNVDHSDARSSLSGMNSARSSMPRLLDTLRNKGLTKSDSFGYNLVYKESLSGEDQKEIINSIYERTENESELDRQASRITGVRPSAQEREQVSLGDISKLAKRRSEGERVSTEEIKELFGEGSHPLYNAQSSYDSTRLVNTVSRELQDEDLFDEVQNLMQSKETPTRSGGLMVSDMIINVANWIIGRRDNKLAQESLVKSGFTPSTADSIINIIKDIVEQQDLC